MQSRLQAGGVAVWVAVSVLAAQSGWAQGNRYTVTELPPLETAVVTMTSINARAMNNSGHVVGFAALPGDPELRRSAFFYSDQNGMKDLDPDGRYFSDALAIHDRGWVYGINAGVDGFPQPFLYDRDFKLDLLNRNASEVLEPALSPFDLSDINNSGDLVGCGQDCSKAVMYTQDEGWLDLSGVDSRFREGFTAATLVNDIGDLVFTIAHPGGFQESFVLLGGEELVELGHFGTPVNVPTGINDSRLMSGISRTAGSDPDVQADGDNHAYFFTPEEGVVDIHPKRYQQSEALGVSEDGVIVGLLFKNGRGGMFTYDRERAKKRRILAKRKNFKKLFPKGTRLQFRPQRLGELDFNERQQIIGRVTAQSGDEAGKRLRRFFFLSPDAGLLDLQQILDSTGYEGEIVAAVDINDRGQVLLSVNRHGPDVPSRPKGASVVLTPVD